MHRRRVLAQLLQRRDESLGVPCDVDAGDVGECFATAGDRELHELGCDGSENDEHQGQGNDEDRRVTAVVIPAATKPTKEQKAKPEVAQQREEPDQGDRDRRDQDVVVANVAELVRENTFELGAVHDLQQARRGRHRRVSRVAPGGERVRCRIVDHIDARFRETDADAQLLDQVVELPELVRIGFPSSGGGDREPVGIEVTRPDQTDRDDERDDDEGCAEPEEQVEGDDRPRDQDCEPGHQVHSSALVGTDLRQQVSALGHMTSCQIVLRTLARAAARNRASLRPSPFTANSQFVLGVSPARVGRIVVCPSQR